MFHTLLGKLEASSALEVRLCTSLSAEDGTKPARGKSSRLNILVLTGDPNMLHSTDIVRNVLIDGINRLVAILSSNVFGSCTHLHKRLQVNLDHWIKRWTQSSCQLLDQVTCVGRSRGSQGIGDLDDTGLHVLYRVHEESVVVGRSVSLQEPPHLGNALVTISPVLFALPAFEMGKHIAESILELSLRMDEDGIHWNLLGWGWAGGFAIDALGEMGIEGREGTS